MTTPTTPELVSVLTSLKQAQRALAPRTRAEKDAALYAAAAALDAARGDILAANARDLERARAGGMKDALLDRLRLDDRRVDGILRGLEDIARLEDPVGRVTAGWRTPGGLLIEKTTVPLGVVAIIYESRPNVTVDAAGLAYKAGCGVLLRGSRAALASNAALVRALKAGLQAGGGVPGAVELAGLGAPGGPGGSDAPGGGREDIDDILRARGLIDVVIPRGGRELIQRVARNALVPVIETGEGNCHLYVEAGADMANAVDIIDNAKTQKPGACNAIETLLVAADALDTLLPPLARRLAGRVELRCDPRAKAALLPGAPPGLLLRDAAPEDWETEFLDLILAVKTVDSLDEAIAHINRYGSGHSEAILTNELRHAERFCEAVDAACVYVNASTRFTDGGEFGFGAELGISTQKLHARGPLGLDALTTIKYRVTGSGQVRA